MNFKESLDTNSGSFTFSKDRSDHKHGVLNRAAALKPQRTERCIFGVLEHTRERWCTLDQFTIQNWNHSTVATPQKCLLGIENECSLMTSTAEVFWLQDEDTLSLAIPYIIL